MASFSMMKRNTMKTLLQLNSSIFASGGQSTQLADQFVVVWHAKEPEAQVLVRDLANDPIPHLDALRVLAFLLSPKRERQNNRPMSLNRMY
jgi:FMN-dependent NADH-azoreductase